MLNLDASIQKRGVTLYRDYNDSSLFWYLPESPKLAREGGQPMFQLLLYRRDITDNPAFREGQDRGGGFLTMTVDLEVPEATLRQLESDLGGLAGGAVRLAPVPFESGSVRVTALGVSAGTPGQVEGGAADGEEGAAGPRFVERILASARPSLYGDNRAVFSIELSAEGAQLLRASLEENGASNISIIYELAYVGLRPAREVSIEIDYRQSYSHLHARAQTNMLWFKSDIDVETERLRQQGRIRIEDVNYLELEPEALNDRAKELQDLAKELAQWTFFKPAMRPGEVLVRDRGELEVYDPTAAAVSNTSGFTTPLNLLLAGTVPSDGGPAVVPGASGRTGGARGGSMTTGGANSDTGTGTTGTGTTGTGTTGAGTTGTETTGAGTTGAGTTGTETTGSGAASPGGGTQPTNRQPTAVERWNQAGRPQAGFLLKSLDQSEQQSLRYDMRQVSAHRRTAAPQGSIRLSAGDADLAGRIREVDLDDPFFQRIVGSVSCGVDLAAAGVRSMAVAIRYGVRPDGSGPKDTADVLLTAEGEKHEFAFFLDHRRTVEIEYRVTVHYAPDFAIGDATASTTSDWIRTSERLLDIDPRTFQGLLPVRVTAGQVDWAVVKGLQTRVVYRDPANGLDDARVVTLRQDASSMSVPIRPKDPAVRAFVATSTWFYAETSETVEETVSRGVELVLNQPPSTAIPVTINARDPLSRLEKVLVELSYREAEGAREQATVLELTGGQSANWTFFRPTLAAPVRWRWRATRFGRDGTTDQGAWVETTERKLDVGDVFPGMLDVQVELVGDLLAAGFRVGRLVLEYPGVPAGTDGRQEFRLPTTEPVIHWRVPSATREPGEYRWTVQYIKDGQRQVTESGAGREETLFLFVPEKAPE